MMFPPMRAARIKATPSQSTFGRSDAGKCTFKCLLLTRFSRSLWSIKTCPRPLVLLWLARPPGGRGAPNFVRQVGLTLPGPGSLGATATASGDGMNGNSVRLLRTRSRPSPLTHLRYAFRDRCEAVRKQSSLNVQVGRKRAARVPRLCRHASVIRALLVGALIVSCGEGRGPSGHGSTMLLTPVPCTRFGAPWESATSPAATFGVHNAGYSVPAVHLAA